MPSLQKLLALLLLLFTTTTLAAPKSKRPKYGNPTAKCKVKKDGVRDTYSLRGNNWNVTGSQLKSGIETPGTVVTGWEFKSAIDIDDIHTFKANMSDAVVVTTCSVGGKVDVW
ncbi:hypothetical protein MBLNU13_g11613t1 [Cladosporium sp. NU13]